MTDKIKSNELIDATEKDTPELMDNYNSEDEW